MRILHIGKYYAPERGGIERYLQNIAEWQAAHGAAVRVLVHQRPGRRHGTSERLGNVEVQRVGCLAAPMYTPISPGYPFAFARSLKEFKPDILHLHMPNPSCFAALCSRSARRIPWVVHWHADISPDVPDWRIRAAYRVYRPFEQALLARACAIVATSPAYLDASAALARWHAKTRVVPLGIGATPASDETDANPAETLSQREWWPRQTSLRLLAVGRLSHYKGFRFLLDALARIPDASLLLVGRGETEPELLAQAGRLGLDARICFAGELDDAALLDAYDAADTLVLPSLDRSEAFGLVLLEAMRASLPVIASAIPGAGVSHVVANGETGVLVPPADVDALADAIRTMQDADLRSRMGNAGFARWQSLFSLDASASALMLLYQQCRSSQ